MENKPLVSVVMSVYNGAKTLELSTRSILQQSYDNIELIICDDGSNDNTAAMLKALAAEDSRVVLLHNKSNLGASASRNRCFKCASGTFIAIMDADDFSAKERIEEQVSFLQRHPEFEMVGTKGQYFVNQPGDTNEFYRFIETPQNGDFLMTLPFVHASLMFRAESIRGLKGYCEKKYVKRSEDYELLMRAYCSGIKGANLRNPLYYIRRDADAFSRRKYRYRFNECVVKFLGFRRMKLMPIGLLYAIKPLVVGLIPPSLLKRMQNKYYMNEKS